MSVFGKDGCGGPEGRGTTGARRSWRVAIFFTRTLLRRVRGAMVGVCSLNLVLSDGRLVVCTAVCVWCADINVAAPCGEGGW